jgi:type I restriction enzyme S subunit
MSRYKAYPEYKDSGVDWIKDIPSNWQVKRISYIASLRSGDAIVAEQIEVEGDFPVYGGNGLRGYTANYNHEGEFILIGRQGALCGNVNYGAGKFWASEHAIVVHPYLAIVTKWFCETLRAMNLNQYNVSAAQPGLAVANITCLKVPFPSLEEQQKIANFLDHETAKIDTLIAKQQELIKLLKEKRQAVISHAVTKGLNPNAPMRDSGVEWLGEVPAHWRVKPLKHICCYSSYVMARMKLLSMRIYPIHVYTDY